MTLLDSYQVGRLPAEVTAEISKRHPNRELTEEDFPIGAILEKDGWRIFMSVKTNLEWVVHKALADQNWLIMHLNPKEGTGDNMTTRVSNLDG